MVVSVLLLHTYLQHKIQENKHKVKVNREMQMIGVNVRLL